MIGIKLVKKMTDWDPVGVRTKGRPKNRWRDEVMISGVPRNFFRGGSTNSVEDRGQREQGSGSGSPLTWKQL